MASPTQDELQAQISRVFWAAENLERAILTGTGELYQSDFDDVVVNAEGDRAALVLAAMDRHRGIVAQTIDWRVIRNVVDLLLLDYAAQQGIPENTPRSILLRLRQVYGEGSERVESSVFTYGSVASITGTGTGSIVRLTVDEYGFNIERCYPENKQFRCIEDRYSGRQLHQEAFEVRGEYTPRDYVSGYGSPQDPTVLQALSADDSQTWIQNPSFASYTPSALPAISELTGWTPNSAITNFEIETSTVYRTAVHEGTAPAALRFKTNDKITQELSVVRPRLGVNVPYYCQIAYYRESNVDGALTLRVGSNSVAVADLTAVSNATWLILSLALDENLYFPNFNATTLDIEIELSGRTTGTLLVDDGVFAPMRRIDGLYYAAIGGATPFLVDDTTSVSDSVAQTGNIENAINQKWFRRLYNIDLPHDTVASGNITWADPS